MTHTRQGYLFTAQRCGNMFGIMEEYKVKYVGTTIRVKALFGVDKHGIPLSSSIFRDGRFVSLSTHLANSADYVVEFDKFLNSHKPTYSLSDGLFIMCSLEGCYDTATQTWLADKTNLDMFMVKAVTDTKYGFSALCNIIKTTTGLNTNCVTPSIYTMYYNTILGNMVQCIQNRSAFISNRLRLMS